MNEADYNGYATDLELSGAGLELMQFLQRRKGEPARQRRPLFHAHYPGPFATDDR